MANRLDSLLDAWRSDPDADWMLAVIASVEGSAYRKSGAMMLFHPSGPSLGMLSGGCLEADLRRQAQKALAGNCAVLGRYDARDETDASYRLGCGGLVDILLLPLTRANHRLQFAAMAEALASGNRGFWCLELPPNRAPADDLCAHFYLEPEAPFPAADFSRPGRLVSGNQTGHTYEQQTEQLIVPVRPRPHLAIFGGGMDARPLAQMARQLEWRISIVDPRTSYARPCDFEGCELLKAEADALSPEFLASIDMAVVMHHSLELDAAILPKLSPLPLKYLALLGPRHRGEKLLNTAGMGWEDFYCPPASPAGIDLGGELPADIALSILAACQASLHGKLTTCARKPNNGGPG
ncbi:XdhC family protein [Shewanella litorisediminis]|uniref:XdhC family protein n=1 Tax=Shewanella litorisediminis TaxID=1173586 RepID=A0ABX7G2V0_9GAMM|nr:XdhC/CoxI family protein [Shewanella litorisediminis]MCL2917173.1 XdhC family protein [Shewanella litorisediminis]QRH01650.1 XdhC family protein [Shewanella litorisediminis]